LAATTLLANARDPDGDPLGVSDVALESFWGSPVVLSGSSVTYTPSPGQVGADRFAYRVSDGRGGVTTAYVELFVFDGAALGVGQVSVAVVPGGLRFRYRGEPGQSCRLQQTRNLSPADWHDIRSFAVPPHGVWESIEGADGEALFMRVVCEH
jgi:hypothetical protein